MGDICYAVQIRPGWSEGERLESVTARKKPNPHLFAPVQVHQCTASTGCPIMSELVTIFTSNGEQRRGVSKVTYATCSSHLSNRLHNIGALGGY